MEEHFFSAVRGVIAPQPQRRAWVRPGCRPHIAWVTETAGTASAYRTLGRQESLRKGDSSGGGLALCQLLTVDPETGTQLCLYTPAPKDRDVAGAPPAVHTFPAIPSGRRVAAVVPCGGWAGSAEREGSCFASDTAGNVYHFSSTAVGAAGAGAAVVGAKRPRGGEGDVEGRWSLLAPQDTPLGAPAPAVSGGALGELLSVSRGVGGWAGLAAVPGDVRLISVREGYSDVRELDPETGVVLNAFSTTHAPTGCLATSPYTLVVAEGTLATVFDLRARAAVDWNDFSTVADLRGAPAPPPAPASLGEDQPQPQQRGDTERSSRLPLVPARLTSTTGVVTDVCGTARADEIALSIDRALCLFDTRKFTRLATSTNVLKYTIGSVSSVAGGRACVCTGIDAEVRVVALAPKTEAGSGGRKPQSAAEAGAQPETHSGTFRTRLNTTVCCESNWSGGWVSSCNLNGAASVGISMNNEVFLAQ